MVGSLIELRKLQKTYLSTQGQRRELFLGLDASFIGCRSLAILGPSGCGKSTLLRCLSGLESFEGEVRFEVAKPKFTFVFQEPRLLPWLSVRENLRLPFELQKKNISEEELVNVLNLVQLGTSSSQYPDELSGGMKMRASLARALLQSPDYLLLDEPLGALDDWTRSLLQAELLEMIKKSRIQRAVLVTHSITEAVLLSEKILLLGRNGEKAAEFDTVKALGAIEARLSSQRFSLSFSQLCEAINSELQRAQNPSADLRFGEVR